ncbi:MAG: carbohydrate kinase family protein [Candidatus Daviesbacteria bacterium]|nr:carbohydrate kinase family protein [Candidatus Daviesbacteria bacterium]
MFDLISVGDCMIDHFFKIHDAHVALSVDKTKKELCINYGDKIGVDQYDQLVAGNAANNAVGSSRLGLKTAFYTNVGSDPMGQKVIHKMKEEKVESKYVTVNQGLDSNVSAVINFKGERTILVYHQPWKYDLPDLDRTKWVYFTSMSPTFADSKIVDQLINYLERTGARLGFNPGTHQLKHGVKKFPRLLSLMTVLFVNVQEAMLILGLEEKVNIKKLLKGLSDLGPKMVVITDGGEGSYGFDGESYYKLGVFKAKLLEMTGAGDAFATGTVAGLFHGQILSEAMRWGAANSASVVEQVGPQAGLLTLEAIQSRLKENSNLMAREIS